MDIKSILGNAVKEMNERACRRAPPSPQLYFMNQPSFDPNSVDFV